MKINTEPNIPLNQYLKANEDALRANPPPAQSAYYGDPAGAWAYIARTIGAGLADYQDQELREARGTFYNLIVIPCMLTGAKVPVDAKQWLQWIDGAIAKQRARQGQTT